jgi:hypothetical protein
LAIELVDVVRIAGADVGLIEWRDLLCGWLHADAVRTGSCGVRPGSRWLVRRPCSKDHDEEPDSKGQHCRCTARNQSVFELRREQRKEGSAGFVADAVDLPGCLGGAAVKLSDVLSDSLRDVVAPRRHLFTAISLALKIPRCPQSRLPDVRITSSVGEFPIPTGQLAQLTRILHAALLIVSPTLCSRRHVRALPVRAERLYLAF